MRVSPHFKPKLKAEGYTAIASFLLAYATQGQILPFVVVSPQPVGRVLLNLFDTTEEALPCSGQVNLATV